MCDTMVVVPASGARPVWFAKNSDREPGEAQALELHPRAPARGTTVAATWMRVPEASATAQVLLSRPTWMWGAETAVNEHGVAIGNEAVFTRLPVASVGLTGMDLVRLAAERARTAEDALERITWLLARYGQGGRCGFRDRGFRYHSAFVIADARDAWLLETADRFWAAVRVRGVRTTSNVLTIDAPDARLGPGTLEGARRHGLWDGRGAFSFRGAFGRRSMAVLSGGDVRRANTARTLAGSDGGAGMDLARCVATLRDHGGLGPTEGLRMEAPCAHASALPTRRAGQTTSSLVAALRPRGPEVWATGTSAPCLSVFKPVPLAAGDSPDLGPVPRTGAADRESLWWRHERLHRAVVRRDFAAAREVFEPWRLELEARAWQSRTVVDASDRWAEHRAAALAWALAVERVALPKGGGVGQRLSRAFWAAESRRDGL